MAETLYRIRFIQDSDPCMSPRDWDNLGHIVCWHRRYELGDVRPLEEPAEWLEALREDEPDAIILPLFLYEHGSITIRCESFSDPWDSGQVGYVYATPDDAKRIGVDWDREQVEKYLRAEIGTYDQFIRGEVFGYVLERGSECSLGETHWEQEDSCWGFYGSDLDDSGALDSIGEEHTEMARKAFNEGMGIEYP